MSLHIVSVLKATCLLSSHSATSSASSTGVTGSDGRGLYLCLCFTKFKPSFTIKLHSISHRVHLLLEYIVEVGGTP